MWGGVRAGSQRGKPCQSRGHSVGHILSFTYTAVWRGVRASIPPTLVHGTSGIGEGTPQGQRVLAFGQVFPEPEAAVESRKDGAAFHSDLDADISAADLLGRHSCGR